MVESVFKGEALRFSELFCSSANCVLFSDFYRAFTFGTAFDFTYY